MSAGTEKQYDENTLSSVSNTFYHHIQLVSSTLLQCLNEFCPLN